MKNAVNLFMHILLISGLAINAPSVFAGNIPADEESKLMKSAEKSYEKGNKDKAKELYLEVLVLNPDNARANYMTGRCYLETVDRTKSLDYFLAAEKLDPAAGEDLNYYIAKSYHLNSEFDQAITYYKKVTGNKGEEAQRGITECNTGKILKRTPRELKVEALGEGINTSFPEYTPVVTGDDKRLFFTSRRKGTTGNKIDDQNRYQYFEDVYMSKFEDGKWAEAVNIGSPVNTKDHDAIVSISYDGSQLFIYRGDNNGDLFSATYDTNKNKWSKPKSLNINSNSYENHASLSPDGKTLYTSMERPGGYGGTDIYYSTKDEEGNWSEPKNLGPKINTKFDEDGPNIAYDNKTLYFSSKGHNTIGGYDIFRSVKSGNDWVTPENLGYPLNSPDDDLHITLSGPLEGNESAMHGYFSSVRPGGYGEKDIFKIILPTKENVQLAIRIKDCETGELIPASISSEVDGVNMEKGIYQYVFTEDADKTYTFTAENEGYKSASKTVNIPKTNTVAIKLTETICLEKIPGEQPAPEEKPKEVIDIKTIYFDFDKSDLRAESKTELDKLVQLLELHPEATVSVEGHCDFRGTEAYNDKLAEKRSKAAIDYAVKKGADRSRLKLKGFGENQPEAPNDSEENMQLNRRVEFVISK